MNHIAGIGTGPGHGRQDTAEPRRAESGRWPLLEAALAAVNRDLSATVPGQDALVLVAEPSRGGPRPDRHVPEQGHVLEQGHEVEHGHIPEQVYVAMPDGRWHGDRVNHWETEEPEPDDPATALAVVAEAAQSTVMELLRQVWPVCPEHGSGVHVRPAGATDDRDHGQAGAAGPPVWWCGGGREGRCHDVAPVGELATRPGTRRLPE
ncbi:hypothetical protein [Streptomyces fragilis]|uniref:Uncharacterized protein n=1 Tax=Streptomyces fragilis TaxID=67301 RepID=A0ABV2YI79_9ACTN|nr:hypothetical protein [Streptomyces fragilis]